MANEIIERVARALSPETWERLDSGEISDDVNDQRYHSIKAARNAIEATREPTDAEIDAAYHNEKGDLTHREIKSAWSSVVKAVLDDK